MIILTSELALVKFDSLNLAIVKGHEPKDKKKGYGNRVLSYHGNIQGAFKSALNHQIRESADSVESQNILDVINELHKRIKSLDYPSIRKLMKGESDEK